MMQILQYSNNIAIFQRAIRNMGFARIVASLQWRCWMQLPLMHQEEVHWLTYVSQQSICWHLLASLDLSGHVMSSLMQSILPPISPDD